MTRRPVSLVCRRPKVRSAVVLLLVLGSICFNQNVNVRCYYCCCYCNGHLPLTSTLRYSSCNMVQDIRAVSVQCVSNLWARSVIGPAPEEETDRQVEPIPTRLAAADAITRCCVIYSPKILSQCDSTSEKTKDGPSSTQIQGGDF